MAHRKGAGSAKNLSDSKPKYLGVKRADGQTVNTGQVIVRQRGTKIQPGTNVAVGKDHTLYATASGTVQFGSQRHKRFDNKTTRKKVVHVISNS